jgi:hypothetical protein
MFSQIPPAVFAPAATSPSPAKGIQGAGLTQTWPTTRPIPRYRPEYNGLPGKEALPLPTAVRSTAPSHQAILGNKGEHGRSRAVYCTVVSDGPVPPPTTGPCRHRRQTHQFAKKVLLGIREVLQPQVLPLLLPALLLMLTLLLLLRRLLSTTCNTPQHAVQQLPPARSPQK